MAGLTLEQLQAMGAKPVKKPAQTDPSKGLSLEELQAMGAKPVQAESPAIKEPEAPRSVLGHVGKFASDVFKGITKPVVTLGVRPIQAGIALAGGSEEDQSINLPYYGKIETSRNAGDVIKDVGRGVETVALGFGGGAVKGTAKQALKQTTGQLIKRGGIEGLKAGTAFGFGSGLEQEGSNALTAEGAGNVLKSTAIGAGTGLVAGAAVPAAIGAGKAIYRGAKAVPNIFAKAKAPVSEISQRVSEVPGKLSESFARSSERSAKIRSAPPPEAGAMRAGIDDNVVDFVSTLKPQERTIAQKMTSLAKESSKNLRFADKTKNMPKRLLGEDFLKRVKTISDDSGKAAATLKRLVDKNPNERIDIREPITKWLEGLADDGILPRYNDAGTKIIGFTSKGRVPSAEVKYYNQILKEIAGVTGRSRNITKQSAHQLRQRLFATLEQASREGGKPGQRPFSDIVDRHINQLRSMLSEKIGGAYQDAAKRYAVNEKTLREVAKTAGVPNQWERLSAKDLKLSEVLMRVLGNAKDRPQTLIDDIERLATQRGGKYGTDLNALARFADILENVYPSSQTRTFRGQGARAGLDVVSEVTGAAKDTIRGNIFGAISRPVRALFGTSDDDAIKAFEKLVFEGGKKASVFGKKVIKK